MNLGEKLVRLYIVRKRHLASIPVAHWPRRETTEVAITRRREVQVGQTMEASK